MSNFKNKGWGYPTDTLLDGGTVTGVVNMSLLTASRALFTDGSKNIVSNIITGTGNVVMSASPTLTGTIAAAASNFSGNVGVNKSSPAFADGGVLDVGGWVECNGIRSNRGDGDLYIQVTANTDNIYFGGTSADSSKALIWNNGEIFANLPTSAGTSGSLWNDSGTVKVA